MLEEMGVELFERGEGVQVGVEESVDCSKHRNINIDREGLFKQNR